MYPLKHAIQRPSYNPDPPYASLNQQYTAFHIGNRVVLVLYTHTSGPSGQQEPKMIDYKKHTGHKYFGIDLQEL